MLNKLILVMMLVFSFMITSCASHRSANEDSGMIIGGLIGGALGHRIGGGSGRTIATVIGTIIGMNIGGNIGYSMDKNDRLKVAHSLEMVRTGVATNWRNPDTGNRYQMVPTRTYDKKGSPCREYQLDATIGGKMEQIYGTACRQNDGSWKVKK